jgi:hypothetical protein
MPGYLSISSQYISAAYKKTLWSESASELYGPSDRRSPVKLVPTFADRGYQVISVTDP